MKVQCGQCPAKYAVSDDRIRGKKVRIHCKRCGAAIVVDGRSDPAIVTCHASGAEERPSIEPSAPPEPAGSVAPSRPPAPTILGGMQAPREEAAALASEPPSSPSPAAPADPSGRPSAERGSTDPPAGSDSSRWRVALTRQDLRWMTMPEVQEAFRAGAIRAETFVTRKDMASWEVLSGVEELAAAVGLTFNPEATKITTEPPPSSRPPARKPPSSRPPPRKRAEAEAEEAGVSSRPRASSAEISAKGGSPSIAHSLAETLEGTEADESMPFALDAKRASRRPDELVAAIAPSAHADESLFSDKANPPAEAGGMPLAPPEVPAGGTRNPWLIAIVILIVLLGVAGVVVAGRLGYLPYSP